MTMTNDTPPQPLSIREAQDIVDTWIRTTGVRYFSGEYGVGARN